jgi:4-diphosphocytidyl-2-C-methyl-D-erythritol kinase
VGRRRDGYHLLDSVFQEIDFSDELFWDPLAEPSVSLSDLQRAFIFEPSSTERSEDNLLVRGIAAFQEASGILVGGQWRLVKHVPAGAGLGGGSADAAAALKVLNEHFEFPLSSCELHRLALTLGADVPFFLEGGKQRVTGIGDGLEPLPSGNGPTSGWLVYPSFAVPTASVFAAFRKAFPDPLSLNRKERTQPNDLQPAAFACEPRLKEFADALTQCFPRQSVFMTGSGGAHVLLSDVSTFPEVQPLDWWRQNVPFFGGVTTFRCVFRNRYKEFNRDSP